MERAPLPVLENAMSGYSFLARSAPVVVACFLSLVPGGAGAESTRAELSPTPAHRALAISGAVPRLVPPASMKVLPGETAAQLIYATDAGGDPLTFVKGAGPEYMTVSTLDLGAGTAVGRIQLEPSASDTIGVVPASVLATDGALFDEAFFTIVGADNPPVLLQPGDMQVEPWRVADQALQATDPDQDPLVFSLARGPWFVTVTTNGPGSGNVRASPVVADSGSHQVFVSVSDGMAMDVRGFQIVVPTQTTPSLDSLKDMSVLPGQVTMQALRAFDVDGQACTFYKSGGPDYMQVFTWPSYSGVTNGRIELRPQLADSPTPEGGTFDVPAAVGVTDGERSEERSFIVHITERLDGMPPTRRAWRSRAASTITSFGRARFPAAGGWCSYDEVRSMRRGGHHGGRSEGDLSIG